MGRFVASFSECDAAALGDVAGLVRALRRATAASGASLVQSAEERFAPDGFLVAIATREGQARLRTIPERAVCIVEFRFDDGCQAEAFAAVLGTYLRSRQRAPAVPLALHPTVLPRPAEAATAPGRA